MSPLCCLALSAAAFVGTHFLLSHPLRAPLIARLGEKGFAGLYTVIALLTFGAVIYFYPKASADGAPWWSVNDAGWIAASLLMWFGAILFVGSLRRNPAFPRPGRPIQSIEPPSGVFAITRHPMNWGFASWALVHAIVNATPAALIVSAAIFVLSIGGSVGQDAKKERMLGDAWREWEAKTAFFPFGRGFALPDGFAFVVGTLLFLLVTWLHPIPAGVWRWIG